MEEIKLEEVLKKNLEDITPEERQALIDYYRDLRSTWLAKEEEKAKAPKKSDGKVTSENIDEISF